MSPSSQTVEPARGMHIDYSLTGLRSTIRHCRADFHAAGSAHLSAVSASATAGNSTDPAPRIAAYSVWRPLARVTRDPIAVLDYTTARPERWAPFDYRSTGYEGDYLLEGYAVDAPQDGDGEEEQRYYYVSEQMPEEVMVIKFADSASEGDEGVARGCGHGSPAVVGQGGETRESVEARVLAFW
jgi:hypothetical protein